MALEAVGAAVRAGDWAAALPETAAAAEARASTVPVLMATARVAMARMVEDMEPLLASSWST